MFYIHFVYFIFFYFYLPQFVRPPLEFVEIVCVRGTEGLKFKLVSPVVVDVAVFFFYILLACFLLI